MYRPPWLLRSALVLKCAFSEGKKLLSIQRVFHRQILQSEARRKFILQKSKSPIYEGGKVAPVNGEWMNNGKVSLH